MQDIINHNSNRDFRNEINKTPLPIWDCRRVCKHKCYENWHSVCCTDEHSHCNSSGHNRCSRCHNRCSHCHESDLDCKCNCSNGEHDSDMCNGVFERICEPQVCDTPRIPRMHELVVGNGTIVDLINNNEYRFTIHIYKEYETVLGEFSLYTNLGKEILTSKKIECYHSPDKNNMIAVFHVMLDNNTSREVTLYAKNEISGSPAALYVYSAPLFDSEIRIGSELKQGQLTIYADTGSHEH